MGKKRIAKEGLSGVRAALEDLQGYFEEIASGERGGAGAFLHFISQMQRDANALEGQSREFLGALPSSTEKAAFDDAVRKLVAWLDTFSPTAPPTERDVSQAKRRAKQCRDLARGAARLFAAASNFDDDEEP